MKPKSFIGLSFIGLGSFFKSRVKSMQNSVLSPAKLGFRSYRDSLLFATMILPQSASFSYARKHFWKLMNRFQFNMLPDAMNLAKLIDLLLQERRNITLSKIVVSIPKMECSAETLSLPLISKQTPGVEQQSN